MARCRPRPPNTVLAVHAVLLSLLIGFLPTPGNAQNTGRTVRRHRVIDTTASEIASAEAAMERGEYERAGQQLKQLAVTEPGNYRVWFDLGVIYTETGRATEAIAAYRNSVKADPKIFESTLNLGLLLARANDPDAEAFLRMATRLKPSSQENESLAKAWVALGHLLEAKPLEAKPPTEAAASEAIRAFQSASELQPANAELHLLAAHAAARAKDWAVAEKEFSAAARLAPDSSEAQSGLMDVYLQSRQLPKAEAALRAFLQQAPKDGADPQHRQAAHLQLGRVLAAQGKIEDALPELEAGLSGTQDVSARRDLIQIYLSAGKYDKAAEHLRALLQANPNDPEMRAQLGGALVQQHQYGEAQKELLMAVQLNPKLPQAYTDLALAASENKDYALCLQALDARAKLLPEAAGSLFLRAVAYDHLQDKEHAIENYQKFLELADGRFPDQEWQARHRIIAIDPKAIDPRAGDSRKRP